MKSSTHTTRLIRMLVLGAIVAGTIASTADALPVVDRDGPSVLAAGPFNRDTSYREAARAVPVGLPDAFERYATAHPYGSGLAVSLPFDRDTSYRAAARAVPTPLPDVLERFATAHPYGSGLPSISSPRHTVTRGFDWGDWAIGIGTGMGLILLLGGGVGIGLQLRHRVQTA